MTRLLSLLKNPQRLLEFYESLSRQGKASEIRYLLRVWSMEIHPESPYDGGFPHCTLLWIKQMNLTSHIEKWRNAQLQSNQRQANRLVGSSLAQTSFGTMMYNDGNKTYILFTSFTLAYFSLAYLGNDLEDVAPIRRLECNASSDEFVQSQLDSEFAFMQQSAMAALSGWIGTYQVGKATSESTGKIVQFQNAGPISSL